MADLLLQDISKYFHRTQALKDINLTIKEGTFFVILGPSGCGKSTLLNVIAGLEEPERGKIYLGDKEITGLPPYKRNIAMVFQNYALYPHLSVFENIAFGLRAKGEKKEVISEQISRVSRILNIEDKLDQFPHQLSGGQRQRVATGRAIVREPVLFLFDEPLSNLDARMRVELRAEFIKLHQRLKKTIIYVTHDQIEAMSLGEEVVVLNEGRVMQVAPARQLYDNPANLFVAEFIGTPPMNIMRFNLKSSAGTLQFCKGNFTLQAPKEAVSALSRYAGEDIYFGFRPSAVRISDTGQIRAEVIFTEVIGEDSFARMRIHPEIEINVRIGASVQLKPKDRARIDIDNGRFYLFDARQQRIHI